MISRFFSRITRFFGKSSKSSLSGDEYIELKIGELQEFLNFSINNRVYFIKALTHRSYLDISPELKKNNERLEYLGDAVLDLIVSEYLFKHYPDEDEGFLTKSRSHLVDKKSLADTAENVNLERFILYNKKFLRGSEGGLRTILADAMEALIGAIYLDQGLETAKIFVKKHIIRPGVKSGTLHADNNYKGQLLELTHVNKWENPTYKCVNEEGPQHAKTFTIHVIVNDEIAGKGTGKNKKGAEQEAAKEALDKLS
ncbi:MAG: ribonuclease 3 [Melioribacteraceae bacterium]|nr:MAG: ribonuclease 3 [Melioribacteraceae bacterium]